MLDALRAAYVMFVMVLLTSAIIVFAYIVAATLIVVM